jgi:uncharacterized protein (DUF924 family)
MESKSLLNLFNFWYGIKLIPTQENRLYNSMITNLPIDKLTEQWTTVWFAKKDLQVIMDKELLQYESLIEDLKDYKPTEFYEKMALIVLYDQIPRNIFRKTSKAYEYDSIARDICLDLLGSIQEVGIQYRLTLLICLCHSENIEHQTYVREYVKTLRDEFKDYKEVINAMTKISDNHYIRVSQFGRIPERNPYVGRTNTEAENDFLKYLK